jgi:hypothetical protein
VSSKKTGRDEDQAVSSKKTGRDEDQAVSSKKTGRDEDQMSQVLRVSNAAARPGADAICRVTLTG